MFLTPESGLPTDERFPRASDLGPGAEAPTPCSEAGLSLFEGLILISMDRGDGLFNARAFAQTAYTDELERLTRQYQEMLAAKVSELAGGGSVLSGSMVREDARINGELISKLLRARLRFLLEGYKLYDVELDDHLSTVTVSEITQLRERMIAHANHSYETKSPTRDLVKVSHYTELLQKHIDVSENGVRTDIARERRMKKPSTAVSNIYHVYGHNARWVTNSNDHSVNRAGFRQLAAGDRVSCSSGRGEDGHP
jgi:hypothetical protein